jgi:hypothetical protein
MEVYKPSEKEKNLLVDIYSKFTDIRDERQTYDQYWEAYEKQWEGYFSDTIEDSSRSSFGDYRANVWVPMTYWFTMTAISELVQQNPIINLIPQSDEDIPMTEIHEEIMNASLERGQFIVQFYRTLLNAGILGDGWLHDFYRCDDREIKEITAYDPLKPGSVEYKKMKIHDYQDVYAEAVSPWFVYPYTYAVDSMDSLNGLMRLYILDEDEFMSLYKNKYPNAKYVKSASRYVDEDTNWDWWDSSGLSYLGGNQVQVLWDYNKQKDEMNIVANGVLLTAPDNPIPFKHKQIPFVHIPWVKRANRLSGKGMCETLEKLQYETNVSRNLALDQMRLNILKVFFINAQAGISEDQLQLRPGFAIPVQGDPRNAVFPLEYGDIKQSFYELTNMTQKDAEKTTGIAPELTGTPSANSATQAAILKESTLKRIQLQALLYYAEGLTRFGRLRLKNIQQFYQDPVKVEKVVGKDKVETIYRQYRKLMLKNKALGAESQVCPECNGVGTSADGMPCQTCGGQKFIPNPEGGYKLLQSEDKYNFASLIPDLFKNPQTDHFYDFDVRVNPESSTRISEALKLEQDKEFYMMFKGDPDFDQTKLKEEMIRDFKKNPENLLIQQPEGVAGVGPMNQNPPAAMGRNQTGSPLNMPSGAPSPSTTAPQAPAAPPMKQIMGAEFGGMPI